jgi:ankyrin repeat protein
VSFTPISDISTIPCGHVFHTDCIEKWLQNGSNSCSQCRKEFQRREITKLYFSTSPSENDLVSELEEAKTEAEKRTLKFQRQNSELREENLKLSGHLKDLQKDSEIKEKTLKSRIEELTAENKNLKSEGSNPKGKKVVEENINPSGTQRNQKASKENDIENYNLLEEAIINNDKETCKNILHKIQNKNPVYSRGNTALHKAAIYGRTDIVKMIMAEVENKNPKYNNGYTPLHEAANYGHPKIVKMILDGVEDKNQKNNSGYTPLKTQAI